MSAVISNDLQANRTLRDQDKTVEVETVREPTLRRPPQDSKESLKGLLVSLASDVGQVVKDEVDAARSELKHRTVDVGRHSGMVAGGLVVAAGGVPLAMAGLAFGLAGLFRSLGFAPSLADLVGFLFIGLLTVGGGLLLSKHAKTKLVEEDFSPTNDNHQ